MNDFHDLQIWFPKHKDRRRQILVQDSDSKAQIPQTVSQSLRRRKRFVFAFSNSRSIQAAEIKKPTWLEVFGSLQIRRFFSVKLLSQKLTWKKAAVDGLQLESSRI